MNVFATHGGKSVPTIHKATLTDERLDEFLGNTRYEDLESLALSANCMNVERLKSLSMFNDPSKLTTFTIDSIQSPSKSKTEETDTSLHKYRDSLDQLTQIVRHTSKPTFVHRMMGYEMKKLVSQSKPVVNVGTVGKIPMWKEYVGGREITVPQIFKQTRVKWYVDRMYELIYSYPGALGVKPNIGEKY